MKKYSFFIIALLIIGIFLVSGCSNKLSQDEAEEIVLQETRDTMKQMLSTTSWGGVRQKMNDLREETESIKVMYSQKEGDGWLVTLVVGPSSTKTIKAKISNNEEVTFLDLEKFEEKNKLKDYFW